VKTGRRAAENRGKKGRARVQHTPRHELETRLVKVQAKLRSRDLDGALILQKADLFYLSGTAQNAGLFVPADGEPILAVRRSLHRARTESAWPEVVPMKGWEDLPGLLAHRGYGSFRNLGLELDVVPARIYLQLGEILEGVRFTDVSPILREVRMVKSPFEIERIEQAAEQLRQVFALIPEMFREGCQREIDLAARIEGALRQRRHQGLVRTRRFGLEMYFGAVSAGASASYPTDFDGPDGVEGLYAAAPQSGGERLLRRGEPIFVDLCGGYEGYIADKTRIFVPGGLRDEEMLRAHHFALQLQAEIQARMRPGAHTGRIYQAIEEMVRESPFAGNFMGYGDNRSRFVGHGVGLELDELPVLTAKSEVMLREGMVVAVEPKFFFGDRGGVGIENTWVITQDGCRNLTADSDDIVTV
jgi:Xaa-Pro aminopeptidase